MKKLFRTLIIAVLVVVSAISMVACDNNGNETKKGLLSKQFSGEDFYTVYRYTDAGDGITELSVELEGKEIGRIMEGTFSGDVLLNKLTIAKSVTEIQTGALKNMKKLTTLTIPFVGLNANADAYMHETDGQENKAVDAKRTFAYIFGSEEYEYGSKITSNYGAGTEDRYIPATLNAVIVSPKENYKLPMYAFAGVTIITNVKLDEKVIAIGTHAFDGCRSMTDLTISKEVKNIYAEAFKGCENLKAINFNGTKDEFGEITLSKNWDKDSSLVKIVCSDGEILLNID